MSEIRVSPDCEGARPELNAYLDDELSLAERAAIERHLESCAGCRAELELLRLVTGSLRQVARPEPAEAMRQRLLALVSAELPPRRMEIFIRERHGDQEVQRREVRLYREPVQAVRTGTVAAPPLGMIIQRRQQLTDGPNCYQVIESSYGRD